MYQTHWMLSRRTFLCLFAPPLPRPFPPLPRPDIVDESLGWSKVNRERGDGWLVMWIRKKRNERGDDEFIGSDTVAARLIPTR